jgi:hypothetical protein
MHRQCACRIINIQLQVQHAPGNLEQRTEMLAVQDTVSYGVPLLKGSGDAVHETVQQQCTLQLCSS